MLRRGSDEWLDAPREVLGKINADEPVLRSVVAASEVSGFGKDLLENKWAIMGLKSTIGCQLSPIGP